VRLRPALVLAALAGAACVTRRPDRPARQSELERYHSPHCTSVSTDTVCANMRGRCVTERVHLTDGGDDGPFATVLVNDGRELDSRAVDKLPPEFGDVDSACVAIAATSFAVPLAVSATRTTGMFSCVNFSTAADALTVHSARFVATVALEGAKGRIPRWLKVGYTLLLCVVVPVWAIKNGLANFLWFSDIALLTTGAALWLESALLASTMAVGVLLPEALWNVSFFGRLLTRRRLTGLTDYMFEAEKSRLVRGLSLAFHVVVPVVLLYLLTRLGYDARALPAQSLLAWVVLPVTYLATDPIKNVNWVFGPGGRPQRRIPPLAYLALLMLGFPLVVYLPTHVLLAAAF
jgi:hypothetical protein